MDNKNISLKERCINKWKNNNYDDTIDVIIDAYDDDTIDIIDSNEDEALNL